MNINGKKRAGKSNKAATMMHSKDNDIETQTEQTEETEHVDDIYEIQKTRRGLKI